MENKTLKSLSIVIPFYNEEAVLPMLRQELELVIQRLGVAVELIFVSDGSTDATTPYLLKWANENSNVKVLVLSRNFGHQAAITAGLDHVEGDAVVMMDGDLQDPPEIIGSLIQKYEEGYDVVYAKRKVRRGESWFKIISAHLFYGFMKAFVHKNLPVNVSDFRLMSAEVTQALSAMREQHRFMRGMVTWLGYRQTEVVFERNKRAAGSSKYHFRKMCSLAVNAIFSFSSLPMKVGFFVGLITFLVGSGVAVYAIVRKILYNDFPTGWASIVVLQCLIGGSILIFTGLMGVYIGKIFDEIKKRPLYVVHKSKNVKLRKRDRVVLPQETGDSEKVYDL